MSRGIEGVLGGDKSGGDPEGPVLHSHAVRPALRAKPLEAGKVGMICFLITEVAFFSTLIVTYITYIGKSATGPLPKQVFYMPLVLASTVCLLSSSVTVHLATRALGRGAGGAFRMYWVITIVLGATFLLGTGLEWHDLLFNWKLRPGTNLFGTTYFTLVGFHAFHVTIGLILMTMLLGFSWGRNLPDRRPLDAELVSWYWHFVDGVWVVVFTVVYLVGR